MGSKRFSYFQSPNAAPPLDPDYVAWALNAINPITPAQESAYNSFFVTLKDEGIFSEIRHAFIMAATDEGLSKYSIKVPTHIFRLYGNTGFVAGVGWNTGPFHSGGITDNENLSISTIFTNTSCHLGNVVNNWISTNVYISCGVFKSSNRTMIRNHQLSFNGMGGRLLTTTSIRKYNPNTVGSGFSLIDKTGATKKGYFNGVIGGNVSATDTAVPTNVAMGIMGLNNSGTPSNMPVNTVDFQYSTTGGHLTAGQISAYNLAIKTLFDALGVPHSIV